MKRTHIETLTQYARMDDLCKLKFWTQSFCKIRWRSNVSTKSLLLIMPSYPNRILPSVFNFNQGKPEAGATRTEQPSTELPTRKQGMKHSVPDLQSVFLRPTEKSCIPRFYNTESLKLDPEFANHDAVSPNLAPILFRTSEDRRNMSWKSFRIFNV